MQFIRNKPHTYVILGGILAWMAIASYHFNRIEKDLEEIIGIVNEMKWIDLDDRKPPQDTRVLVNIYDGRPKCLFSTVFICKRIGDQWFYDDNDETELDPKYGIVTHWKPLPESPEIKRNKK